MRTSYSVPHHFCHDILPAKTGGNPLAKSLAQGQRLPNEMILKTEISFVD